SVRGKAMALLLDDVDTDQIAPANLMRTLEPDYRTALFGHQRATAIANGRPLPFDLAPYADAPILVTGENFGCGSAREVAVWALAANGVACIVAPSFSAVFRESCLKNAILPVVLDRPAHAAFAALVVADGGANAFEADLREQSLRAPDGSRFPFAFDRREREALLEGLDDVAATKRYEAAIGAWEEGCARATPWLRRPRIPDGA
ncbi:MAG TPA: hypothetical protein VIL72_03185, partial [Beijerinckiaceae bacterium]